MSETIPGRATPRETVGLIGLGLMGTALADRLIGAGIAVVGFDLEAAKRQKLVAIGGERADGIDELAQRCRHVVIAVFSADQAEAVIAALAGASPASSDRGRTLICTITCDPAHAVLLAQRAASAGFGFVEAPISGTSDQVARGDGV